MSALLYSILPGYHLDRVKYVKINKEYTDYLRILFRVKYVGRIYVKFGMVKALSDLLPPYGHQV